MSLMCGVAGAGKSTYARGLEARGWSRFSIDREAFAAGLTDAASVPPEVAADIRGRQRAVIAEAIRAGRDVVVDYSFWSRTERDDYRALGHAEGADVEVVYFRAPEEVLRRRLSSRRGEHADDFVVDASLLDRFLAGFEPPARDETDVRVIDVSG
ncbi:AAA family ATPase [Phycicoccus avicenniae]|nr:ATP-binding protein [Phycicoccus avicenniae]